MANWIPLLLFWVCIDHRINIFYSFSVLMYWIIIIIGVEMHFGLSVQILFLLCVSNPDLTQPFVDKRKVTGIWTTKSQRTLWKSSFTLTSPPPFSTREMKRKTMPNNLSELWLEKWQPTHYEFDPHYCKTQSFRQ